VFSVFGLLNLFIFKGHYEFKNAFASLLLCELCVKQKIFKRLGIFICHFFETKAGNTKTRRHKDTKFFYKKNANAWKKLPTIKPASINLPATY
jgi:hypothetical protein